MGELPVYWLSSSGLRTISRSVQDDLWEWHPASQFWTIEDEVRHVAVMNRLPLVRMLETLAKHLRRHSHLTPPESVVAEFWG